MGHETKFKFGKNRLRVIVLKLTRYAIYQGTLMGVPASNLITGSLSFVIFCHI